MKRGKKITVLLMMMMTEMWKWRLITIIKGL